MKGKIIRKLFVSFITHCTLTMVIISIVNHLPPHSRKPIYYFPLNLPHILCNSPQANKAIERYHELSLQENKGDEISGKKNFFDMAEI